MKLALNRLEDEQRRTILIFNQRLSRIIAYQVMTSSPLPLLILFGYALGSYFHKLSHGVEWRHAESRVKRSIETRLKPRIDIAGAQALEAQTTQMKLAAA